MGSQSRSRADDASRWLPPPANFAKINVDGVVSRSGERGAAAATCRDHLGIHLGSSLVVFDDTTNPTLLVALAYREAMTLADDLNLRNIHIASDCKGAVHGNEEETVGAHAVVTREVMG